MIRLLNYFIISILLSMGGLTKLIAQEYIPPANSPLAKRQHPRLFFTKKSFNEIKQYIDQYESEDFQRFIYEVDSAYPSGLAEKDRNYLLLDANNFAFLSYAASSGIFSNYSFAYSAREYAQRAYQHAAEIDRRKRLNKKWIKEKSHAAIFQSSKQGGYINLALGVVYDWCYDQLDLQQKQFIAEALYNCFQKRDREINPGDKVKLGLTLISHSHDVGIGGLTFWGDPLGKDYQTKAQEMLNGIQWLWFDRILHLGERLFEGTAGWSEGPNYFSGSVTTLVWYVAAMSTALGQNLINEFIWLHDIPKYTYFYALPMYLQGESPGYYQQRNDAVSLREWEKLATLRQITPIASLIKKEDPDYSGFYKWIIEDSKFKITTKSYEREEPRLHWLFYKFLWGIKDIENKTPEQIGIKKSYRFGLGDAIFLSDLHSDDATKINFYTPKYYLARHNHKDNGSFVIFKYGTLALDAGVGKGTSDLPKSTKTRQPIYHNLVGLYPPKGSTVYSYNMHSNDYADSYKDKANNPGGRNHLGNVLALRFEPDKFDFIDYDYTRTYKGEKYAKRLRRKLLYIRDPHAPKYTNQEYVVILDDIELHKKNISKRWLLHTPAMPKLVDGKWQHHGKGYKTSTGGSVLKVTNTYANSHGRLFLKILQPAKYRLHLRGGMELKKQFLFKNIQKYYWFTDAAGQILGERGPYTDWGAFWAGTHRLEIEDAANDTISQYFIVMQIGDSDNLTDMAAVEKIETDHFAGTLINNNRAVFINNTADPLPGIVYTINSAEQTWHLITGLKPGKYNIRYKSKIVNSPQVAEDGVLFFEYKGRGEFRIALQ